MTNDADAAAQDATISEPTLEQVNSACLSYRHDFGLMKGQERLLLQAQARNWLIAWQKEGLVRHSPAVSGWRPIETAPTDGSDVLTNSEKGVRVARFQPFAWVKDLNWFIALDHGMSGGTYCRPTHWMPLPDGRSQPERCAKCGTPLNGEAALVDGQEWCHPCADGCSWPVSPAESEPSYCTVDGEQWCTDVSESGRCGDCPVTDAERRTRPVTDTEQD